MTRPEQHIDAIPCFEQKAVVERSAHTRPDPVAGFKTSLLVIHDLVGKHKHWLASGSGYFGSLGVGDDGV